MAGWWTSIWDLKHCTRVGRRERGILQLGHSLCPSGPRRPCVRLCRPSRRRVLGSGHRPRILALYSALGPRGAFVFVSGAARRLSALPWVR